MIRRLKYVLTENMTIDNDIIWSKNGFWFTKPNVANMMDEVRNNGLLILVSREEKVMENEMGNKHVINKKKYFLFLC